MKSIFLRMKCFISNTDSCRDCSNGQMIQMRADWIQEGGFKDVSVTLKVLKHDNDFQVGKTNNKNTCTNRYLQL